jgi:hypothetical protein
MRGATLNGFNVLIVPAAVVIATFSPSLFGQQCTTTLDTVSLNGTTLTVTATNAGEPPEVCSAYLTSVVIVIDGVAVAGENGGTCMGLTSCTTTVVSSVSCKPSGPMEISAGGACYKKVGSDCLFVTGTTSTTITSRRTSRT